MVSVKNLMIIVDLETGVMIGAGKTASEAASGTFSTKGPITLSQRPLIDEVFCKLLTAISGGQGTIELKTSDSDPGLLIRDVSFPLPCIQHQVATVSSAAEIDLNLAAVEVIRSIMASLPPPSTPPAAPDRSAKLKKTATGKAAAPARKAGSKKKKR